MEAIKKILQREAVPTDKLIVNKEGEDGLHCIFCVKDMLEAEKKDLRLMTSFPYK